MSAACTTISLHTRSYTAIVNARAFGNATVETDNKHTARET